jgi:hypothetical protein
MPAVFSCGRHTAEIRSMGDVYLIGPAEPLMRVRYNRIKDDVSHAEIELPTYECCDLLSELRTVMHELHIFRDGVPVWQGPITRLEYDVDTVRVYAEDMLWVAKKHTVEEGYNHSHPDIGNVISDMHWQIIVQCFMKNGDPWRMTSGGPLGGDLHLFPIHHADLADDPREARVVFPYSMTTWEDFDKYAEDYGADYTVVNRDIYYWDIHLAWKIIPDLTEEFISDAPRIVEYGNQLITRAIVTNGKGYAGMVVAPDDVLAAYGYIDDLTSNVSESSIVDGPPSVEDVTEWAETARRKLDGAYPSPVAIVIPANTTLLPDSPWTFDDLFPGAWFQITVDRLCRSVTEWQRLHEVVVEERAPNGETINFTAVSSPGSMIIPA